MTCCHYALAPGNESAFAVDPSAVAFGPGVLSEAGEQLRALSSGRVALFTDTTLARLEPVDSVLRSLRAAGLEAEVYDEVHVEPTNVSFQAAAEFAKSGRFDGYVSVGGGSVIDTCKAAILYATYPAEFRAYVNAPVGEGKPAASGARAHRSHVHAHAASDGGGSQRLRRAVPRARVIHGAPVHGPPAPGQAHGSPD